MKVEITLEKAEVMGLVRRHVAGNLLPANHSITSIKMDYLDGVEIVIEEDDPTCPGSEGET